MEKKMRFSINYKTEAGRNLYFKIINSSAAAEHKMRYTHNDFWVVEITEDAKSLEYTYLVKDPTGNILSSEMNSHSVELNSSASQYEIFDVWNKKNFPENYLSNKILEQLSTKKIFRKLRPKKKETHRFKIQAPLYHEGESIVLLGSAEPLGAWNEKSFVKLSQTDLVTWEVSLDLSKVTTPFEYKYCIFNEKTNTLRYESGPNRRGFVIEKKDTVSIYNDHYYKFQLDQLWKAAGVAVPVFSLRSENGYGVGEFEDLKLLADWAHDSGLSIVQLLPINDTTAKKDWTDSYPYAAISVYALHPLYLSLNDLTYPLTAKTKKDFETQRQDLNAKSEVDYEAVMKGKWSILTKVFQANKEKILQDKKFEKFRKENQSWLLPYSVFCSLRDKYGTADFNQWKSLKKYSIKTVERYLRPSHREYHDVMLHLWVQYELDRQLLDAVDYAHSKQVFLKGDLPIGIYRHSVEAWAQPELFDLDFQAGAPPDFFTTVGQNWEFPTYNWERMRENHYGWWKNRFQALEKYFDALRIDHILGFFRIWRIPEHAVQGTLGYFHPANPVTAEEFGRRGIFFDRDRYTKPFINDAILHHILGESKDEAVKEFLIKEKGFYHFKKGFDTQRKVEDYFKKQDKGNDLKDKIFELQSNVLFIEESTHSGPVYHPRFMLQETTSYQYLWPDQKEKLYYLHQEYFFNWQEVLWKHNAMEKLPTLLSNTKMLICGEDLGMVPDCVPQVMDELGILGLKLQRAPKENVPFYNPAASPYLNVVTYSSHDSTTMRQWWKENPELTQRYYNEQLHCDGTAPGELTPELAGLVMKQHLESNAMLAIFPIQEFFAMDSDLRNPDKNIERINDPAEFPHYWKYRMHLSLNDLIENKEFGKKIALSANQSDRFS